MKWVFLLLLSIVSIGCIEKDDGTQVTTRFYVQNDSAATVNILALAGHDSVANFELAQNQKRQVGENNPVAGGDMSFFNADSVLIFLNGSIIRTLINDNSDSSILNIENFVETKKEEYLVERTYFIFEYVKRIQRCFPHGL